MARAHAFALCVAESSSQPWICDRVSTPQTSRGQVCSAEDARGRRAWALRTACKALEVRVVDLADMLGCPPSKAGRLVLAPDERHPNRLPDFFRNDMVKRLEAHPVGARVHAEYVRLLPRFVRPMVQLDLFSKGSR